ncbi:MAG: hypothetical protein ACE5J7_04975 [Candidatus Aenigmatarchaeota archaeon]
MKARKIFIAFAFFSLCATKLAGASIGVAIAPATGTFSVPLDGTELEFTVYNTGSTESSYLLQLGGPAAKFSSVQGEAVIPPNDYRNFKVKIDPSQEVKEGDTYDLTVIAKISSSGNIVTGSESRIKLSFYGVRTRPYPQPDVIEEKESEEPPEEPAISVKPKTNEGDAMASVPPQEFSIPLDITLLILIIIGGLFVFIKRFGYKGFGYKKFG